MADEVLTLLDLAKMKGNELPDIVEEAQKAHPEIQVFPIKRIPGVSYPFTVRTAVPTGAFRNANEGTYKKKSTYKRVIVECHILDIVATVDKAIADAAEEGADVLLAREAAGQMEGQFQHAASQIWYGTSNDSKGFPGLSEAVDSSLRVDAGGTTADTASSVWAVRFTDDGVKIAVGNNGEFAVSDPIVQLIEDDDSKHYLAYVYGVLTRIGLQVGSKWGCGEIYNVTADSGATLDDDMISDLIAKFPAGKQPHALFMSRRSLSQLQKSRTATSPTGAPAPFPTEVAGIGGDNIPIYVTEAIVDTQAIE